MSIFFTACGEDSSDSKQDDKEPESGLNNPPENSRSGPALTAQDLLKASLEGQMSTVREAVKQEIDINSADGAGRTAHMLAAYNGHTEIVRLLLKEGAPVNARNSEGRTSLMFAASGPFPGTVELLLEWEADPDITDQVEGWSALMFAAAEGNREVVKKLLDYNADVMIKDDDGETAVDFAKNNNHVEVVELLQNGYE